MLGGRSMATTVAHPARLSCLDGASDVAQPLRNAFYNRMNDSLDV